MRDSRRGFIGWCVTALAWLLWPHSAAKPERQDRQAVFGMTLCGIAKGCSGEIEVVNPGRLKGQKVKASSLFASVGAHKTVVAQAFGDEWFITGAEV